jgi:hypothetical protein
MAVWLAEGRIDYWVLDDDLAHRRFISQSSGIGRLPDSGRFLVVLVQSLVAWDILFGCWVVYPAVG